MNWSDLRAAWSRIFSKPTPPAPPAPVAPLPSPREPRGIRNHNPGNIRGTGPDGRRLPDWKGQVGVDADGFCRFDHPENGLRALALLMLIYQRKYRLMTIEGLVTRWAPAKGNHGRIENNTAAYIAAVCIESGVRYNDRINLAGDHLMLTKVMRAIVRHENGKQPYAPSVIDEGARRALETK